MIDYPARDMTITVQAGITLGRLQDLLAAENQRLPIDVPRADRATLGGGLAVNVSGPRRFGCGTLRDYVIGISIVNDEGQEIKAGGRVVKNVAGYDLCKLHVGALGTLGVITPGDAQAAAAAGRAGLADASACAAERLAALLDRLHRRARGRCAWSCSTRRPPGRSRRGRTAGCRTRPGWWSSASRTTRGGELAGAATHQGSWPAAGSARRRAGRLAGRAALVGPGRARRLARRTG